MESNKNETDHELKEVATLIHENIKAATHRIKELEEALNKATESVKRYKEAYLNMRDWANQNGLDTTTYGLREE